jgi:hypothetical protein
LSLPRALALVIALAPATGPAATVTGRIIHPGRPEAARGLEVVLLGIGRGAEPIERKARADAEGRFRFDDVSPDAAYMVGTDYEGVRFPGGSVVFDANAPDVERQTRDVIFHIYDRTDDASGLELQGIRWTVDREAGVYRILQLAIVDNPSMKVVVADEGQPPLFRLGLAASHGELETPFGTLPAGVVVEGDGVSLRGPVYPGERPYRFAYDVKEPGDRLRVDLDLPSAAEWVEVLVRDFGAVVEAGLLHPARPVRASDQIYQRFVGFDLAPGTRVPVQVTPLPPLAPLPLSLRVLLAALLAGALCYVVARPLAAVAGPALAEPSLEEGADAEKAALVTALRDLEDDFETGKISAEDRDALRIEVRREALEALSRARGRSRAAPAEAGAESAVGAEAGLGAARDSAALCDCGYRLRPGDRFCGGCGKQL